MTGWLLKRMLRVKWSKKKLEEGPTLGYADVCTMPWAWRGPLNQSVYWFVYWVHDKVSL